MLICLISNIPLLNALQKLTWVRLTVVVEAHGAVLQSRKPIQIYARSCLIQCILVALLKLEHFLFKLVKGRLRFRFTNLNDSLLLLQ